MAYMRVHGSRPDGRTYDRHQAYLYRFTDHRLIEGRPSPSTSTPSTSSLATDSARTAPCTQQHGDAGPGQRAGQLWGISCGSTCDLVRPEFAVDPDWAGTVARSSASVIASCAARRGALLPARRAMTVGECRRIEPCLERCLVAPAGDHEPGGAIVGRFEQFEPFEAVLVVHRTGAGGEAAGQFVAAVLGNADGIDLDDSHPAMVAPKPVQRVHGDPRHDSAWHRLQITRGRGCPAAATATRQRSRS